MRSYLYLILLFLVASSAIGQRTIESSADILQEIKKLKVLTNVLYVAAHPDDENTRLIAWLENEKLARTAYLSLTRGDGGQNLIGTEKGDAMGVLRTQELIEARRTDGGEQFFSRAVDFGYSKTAKETLEKWNKKEVLADVVWTIRKFQPDVIVTRFPPDERGGHGHHTASSMLAEEAFKLAADPKAYPEQLNYVNTWQARRILWDVYWWNAKVREEAIASGGIIEVNIGDYNELLGLSYSEIAADSRSQHKSQGFGSSRSRGNRSEYLKHTAGAKAEKDLFEGINTTWERLQGGSGIQSMIDGIIEKYDVSNPAASVKDLVDLYKKLAELKDQPFVAHKMKELKRVIKAAAGIHVEFLADEYNYPAYQQATVSGTANFISRSSVPVILKSISPAVDSTFEKIKLEPNELLSLNFKHELIAHSSHPYWLKEIKELSKRDVEVFKKAHNPSAEELKMMEKAISSKDPILRRPKQHGLPENLPKISFQYTLEVEGVGIPFEQAIDYRWTDRVDGELHRDVIVSPEVTATPSEKVYIFSSNEPQKINVLLETNKDNFESNIQLNAPEGWKVQPFVIPFKLKNRGEQKLVSFTLTPSTNASVGEITFQFNELEAQAVQRIDYPHIKPQILFPKAQARVVKMELEKSVNNIGYVVGSGDEVAQNLSQVGFNVTSFKADELATTDLSKYETIIVGIRAYNTEESMKNGNSILNEYVKNGGNVIVQYNTSRGLKSDQIGPYPFRISRKRVTKEEATPTFLQKGHPIFKSTE